MILQLSLRDHAIFNSFDPTLCAVATISGGMSSGGNTFDCYTVGDVDVLPLAGTGLTNVYTGDSIADITYGDTFESYPVGSYDGGTPGSSATGLTHIYVRNWPWVTDTFESYTLGADLEGLNGGDFWDAPYVSRENLSAADTFESYTLEADLDGLNGGDDWDAAYVAR